MADVRSLIQDLVARGVDPIDAAEIITKAAIAGASAAGQGSPETADERKKRLARERTERWRASQSVTKASPGVTDNSVTERHEASPERHKASPLTRVGDILLTTEGPCNHTSLQNADVTRESLDVLERQLRAEGSPALNQAAPKLCIVAPILALLNGQTGPPCDLHADVLPVIRSKSKSARPNSISSWDFYRPAILEARDRRLQTNPEVIPLDVRRDRPSAPDRKLEERHDNYRRSFAGAVRAAEDRSVG